MADALTSPDTYILFALVQAIAYLLLIRFLDLYEREPLAVVALLALSGATVAIGIARAGNGLVASVLPEKVGVIFGSAIAAPPVEEIAKGTVLLAAFVGSHVVNARFGWLEFEGVTDGIVYGAAVGLGFAFAEDLHYLVQNPLSGFLDYRERVDLFGPTTLGHALYTAVFGAGLGLATWLRRGVRRIAAPLVGLVAAILMHAVHNGLAQLIMISRFGIDDYLRFKQPTPGAENPYWDPTALSAGLTSEMTRVQRIAEDIVENADRVFMALVLIAIALWLVYQRSVIRSELAEEVSSGLIASEELDLLGRYWRRSRYYWRLLRHGRLDEWRAARRLHAELVDLAFLKWRMRKLGGAQERVERCRARIARLQQAEAAI
jgi:RsiW-degrading membrane proteinase PrsW (M82 family)